MSPLLTAKELFLLPGCREADIEKSLIDVHPGPKTIDILALSPTILARQREPLLARLRQGCSIRLLTTNGIASLMWGRQQAKFLSKFSLLADFQKTIDQEGLSDLFQAREIDWMPSVGMIMVNSRELDGVTWVSIYTPNPSSPSKDKTSLELSNKGSRQLFEFFAAEFRRLWAKASRVYVHDDRARWESLRASVNEGTRRLVRVIAEHSPDVKDFGFVIALPEEFRYFLSVMGEVESTQDPSTGQWYYTFTCEDYRCVAMLLGKMGKTMAAQMVERLSHRYSIGTMVSIGIAGGVSKDVCVGDVLVASQIDDYLHRAKAAVGPAQAAAAAVASDNFDLLAGGSAFPTTHQLVSEIVHVEFNRPGVLMDWRKECEERAKAVLGEHGFDQAREFPSVRTTPQLHADDVHVASGDVVAAAQEFVSWLRERDRNVAAVEMEAGGIIAAVHAHLLPVRTLVVRGISDPSDASKAELEKKFQNRLREMAMVNASLLVKHLLSAHVLPGI